MARKSNVRRTRYENPQAEFPRTPFSIDEVLSELLTTTFGDIEVRPVWAFIETDSLAFVRCSAREPFIGLHYLFNHPGTPREVLRDILAHELLHLRIPPREVDGKRLSHPPEYLAAQEVVIPTFSLTCAWCHLAFLGLVDHDPEAERMWVHRRIARKCRDIPRPTLDEIRSSFLFSGGREPDGEIGASASLCG